MSLSLVLVLMAMLSLAATAAATPVATNDGQYQALGRVFPDPLASCQRAPGAPACSPNAQGNTQAEQFIQIGEFVNALQYLNTSQARGAQRYMEVLPLDGKMGDGSGTKAGPEMFPGNNLPNLEFTPKPSYQSAGLANSTAANGKIKSDIYVVRVTDENVPDAGKKRYALSLSIHGIERAGIEGGVRTIEDLVTAATTRGGQSGFPGDPNKTRMDDRILQAGVDGTAPTFRDVLQKSIIYFTFPNPDGWRRGSITDFPSGGGFFFQRYNGNGVDVNRDWPGVGFSYRPYSGLSEPESRALAGYFNDVKGTTGAQFDAGDDLHGQPEADALSYTLIPNQTKDFAKDLRIRETAKTINRAQFEALKWSPIIQDNDKPRGGGAPCVPGALGDACAKIYAQTWGTVYDTINYTTTGALGDYFDSPIGLNADGIDNEMSFSHLDKNIVFDKQTEQLHVDGNKFLIYAHLSEILNPATGKFDAPGRKGYVPNARLVREQKNAQPPIPPNTRPQDNFRAEEVAPEGSATLPFDVLQTEPAAGQPGIYNGGMRVDIRTDSVQGVATGTTTLRVQCKGCDDHVGVEPDEDGFITIAEDFNQSLIYLQAGATVAVNRPQAFSRAGKKVEWRAVVEGGPPGRVFMDIEFSSGPATIEGDTSGSEAPNASGYDVSNTDFFSDLNKHVSNPNEDFDTVDPRAVIEGRQSLRGLTSLVLADNPLPGYLGLYGGTVEEPTGPKTADFTYQGTGQTVSGGGSGAPGTFEDRKFTIGPNDSNTKVVIRIEFPGATNDYDVRVLYQGQATGDGDEGGTGEGGAAEQIGSSGNQPGKPEEVTIPNPAPGEYTIRVDDYATTTKGFTGTVKFTQGKTATGTGAYSPDEKDAWFRKLSEFVQGGGNLVLTDRGLVALSELTSIPGRAVKRQTVYAGQTTFATDEDTDTLKDPLAKNVNQPGSRFNSGMRRQVFEPTPVGFAIQNSEGADASFARQYDVDRAAWEKAGGRTAGTSADSGARDAEPVYGRTTLGEIKKGNGTIRIAGALLPQPTEEFDHPNGIAPHAVTYTGYILMRNLLEAAGAGGGGPLGQVLPLPPGATKDTFAPTVRLVAPRLASDRFRSGKLRLRFLGSDVGTGITRFAFQVRELGARTGKYRTLTKARRQTALRFSGRPGKTYQFRLRGIDRVGNVSRAVARTTIVPLDDRVKSARFRGFRQQASPTAWLGTYQRGRKRSQSLTFNYRGRDFYLIGLKSRLGGKAVVTFDGRRRVIDTYSPKTLDRAVLLRMRAKATRLHKVTVRPLGKKRAASRGVNVRIDALGIFRRR